MFSRKVFNRSIGVSRCRSLRSCAAAVLILFAAGLVSGAADPPRKLPAERRPGADAPTIPTRMLQARVVVTGLHAAQGIRQVGRFHTGGPFTRNPEFLLQTQSGRALDPERVLIAVSHNLGAAPRNVSTNGMSGKAGSSRT